MRVVIEPITSSVHALAIWDESWSSYNNAYVIRRDDDVLLIDTWKAEHASELERALESLGLKPDEIGTVLLTHGHRDHVGGATLFPQARKHIHRFDLESIPAPLADAVQPDLPDVGTVSGLECVLWGDHTPGSVVFFDPGSRVLFCGDPICFFAEPLEDRLVTSGKRVREGCLEFVRSGLIWQDARVDRAWFKTGLQKLIRFDAEVLATGHGTVLCGEISEFLTAIEQAI
jgi:flavorubredoxin